MEIAIKIHPSKRVAVASALLVLALLVTGCAQSGDAGSANAEPEVSGRDSQQVEPERIQPDSETEPQPEQSPTETVKLVECGQREQDLIESTIDSQTASFAADDFQDAYSYASPSFKANVSLDAFIQIINGSYGPLISSSNLQYSNCVADTNLGLGFIDVRFTQSGTEVYALKYTMVSVDQGWRVDGAGNLEAIGQGS